MNQRVVSSFLGFLFVFAKVSLKGYFRYDGF